MVNFYYDRAIDYFPIFFLYNTDFIKHGISETE